MGLLARFSDIVARTRGKIARGAGKPAAALATDKAVSVASYAEFCEKGTIPAYPLEIFLEISNVCDLKCAMCVQFSALNPLRQKIIKGTRRGFMEQGEISSNLKNVLKHALLVHCFGYGEPTIHPEFRSFLDLISGSEVMIDFFTNGMHLDEEFCRFLVDRNVYKITVSFSGATKETYESIYIGGDFEKVLSGIRCLSDLKKERRARYPIIEVNSLGFRDHVAQFDKFVTLMADHGVDVVLLKPLQSYKNIPELHEHVSFMRPEQEGLIVRRAKEIGRHRGVQVNAELYAKSGVADDLEYDKRMVALKQEADADFEGTGRVFGGNPVSDFAAIAADLQPVRDPDQARIAPRVLDLKVPEAVGRHLLDIRPLRDIASDEAPFHCMEPFKTLYVSRNGATKPCCFSNADGWYLGNAKTDDGGAVWRGEGFRMVRDAITAADYPMKGCESCLRVKSGPQGHSTPLMLQRYLTWHEDNFSGSLREVIATRAPGALRVIASERTEAIMARAREQSARQRRPGAWPTASAVSQPEQFVAGGDCYLHRDFAGDGHPSCGAPDSEEGDAGLSWLLRRWGMRHYRGEGSIVDLGSAPSSVSELVAGLRMNPRFDSIIDSFQRRRDTPMQRFDLAARQNDMSDFESIVGRQVGEASKIRWLASKSIELCIVRGAPKGRPLQRALRTLIPFFAPGETLLIQENFYLETAPNEKVLMGYFGDSVEWLGQVGTSAIFRFVKLPTPDILALDPYHDLSADVCLRLHRQWDVAELPRGIQMRLALSYARLLGRKTGLEDALRHVDQAGKRFGDLLDPKTPGAKGYAKMLLQCRKSLRKAAEREGA